MTPRQYAILGLLAPLLFWVTYLVMSNLRAEYSFLTKAVSELGSLDAPNRWTWNILGYVLTGLLISVYSFGLFKSISNGQGSKFPLVSFVLSGLFMSLAGIFPGDFNNRQSTTMLIHTIGSFGSYLFFLIGAFTYPGQMKKSDYWKKYIKPTLIFAWLTILFGVWPFLFPAIPGVGQRLVFFFFLLWIFYTSVGLYKSVEPNAVRQRSKQHGAARQ
jgi:hypothetical membrane protein